MKIKQSFFLFSFFSILVFTSCSGGSKVDLTDSTWKLAEVRGKTPEAFINSFVLSDTTIAKGSIDSMQAALRLTADDYTITFSRDSSGFYRFKGTGRSNVVAGRYALEEDNRFLVHIEPMRKACPYKAFTRLDEEFIHWIGEADFYEVRGEKQDTLILIDGLVPSITLVRVR